MQTFNSAFLNFFFLIFCPSKRYQMSTRQPFLLDGSKQYLCVNFTFAVFSVASKTRRTRTAGNVSGVLETAYTWVASFIATSRNGNITVSARITNIANATVIVHLIKTRPCLKTWKNMSVRSFALKSLAFLQIITVYGIGNRYGTVTARCVVSPINQPSLNNVSLTISIKNIKKISLKLIRNSLITYNSAVLVTCETSSPILLLSTLLQ